jgi:ABC-type transport system involved in multi-copper enzyme maturation permease subunit
MWKLLRMDLIFDWKTLVFTYGLWSVLWLGGPVIEPSGHLTFGLWSGWVAVACAFLPIILVGREDKFKAWALACSLPVTRDAIVASRYLGGWIVALAGVAISAAAMGALWLVGVRPLLPPTPMLPVLVLVLIGITLALMMPLTLRFGIVGIIGILVVTQLLGVAAVVASVLFRIPAVQSVESAVKGVSTAVAHMRATLGTVAFSAVLLLAVTVLNGVSFGLSAWIYRRRDF